METAHGNNGHISAHLKIVFYMWCLEEMCKSIALLIQVQQENESQLCSVYPLFPFTIDVSIPAAYQATYLLAQCLFLTGAKGWQKLRN